MSKMFPNLFSPIKINQLEIKNRIVKAPQSTGMSNMDGTVSERLIRHYRELAKGGTGLVIVEYAYVDDIASKSAHCQLGISNKEHIPGLGWLADVIKDYGAVAGIQIEHCGRQKFLGTHPMKSASQIPWPKIYDTYGTVPDAMTIPEIEAVVEAFGEAAERAVLAGFQLIEIHGAHGYLITNFLSPHTNKRNDFYGGSLENRMRILVQIVNNIRSRIGYDFPLTVRLSGTDYEPDGLTIEDTIQICKKMEEIGIDAIHVSGGDHHTMIHQVTPMALPVCHNTWAAERIKKEVSIPVIASGSITLPEYAEEIIRTGKGDMVGLGRPLWADQYWPAKAEADHPEDIRPCIRCNEGCLERTFFLYRSVTCALNPTIGREGELDIVPAPRSKKVAIVGGGPAGMEAARVCKLRGHEVTLFEKRKLGGFLHEASVPDFKSDIRPFLKYQVTQIEKLGIKVVEEEATLETLTGKGFDTIILAVGAKPLDLKVPGADSPNVVNALDILAGKVQPGKKLAVIGGGLIGTETALDLAEKGHKVTLIEMQDEIMTDCAATDKLAYAERIAATDMQILTKHTVKEIKNGAVVAQGRKGITEVAAETIIVAVGLAPDSTLYQDIKDKLDVEVYKIGDYVKAGKIMDAIHTGYKTGLKI